MAVARGHGCIIFRDGASAGRDHCVPLAQLVLAEISVRDGLVLRVNATIWTVDTGAQTTTDARSVQA